MALKTSIRDGAGQGYAASVTSDRALLVTQSPFPPGGEQRIIPFRAYLTNAAGANDMRVVGSLAAPQNFYVTADSNADRYITQISFLIADVGAIPNNFGNIAALTNGCRFYYQRADRDVTIHEGMKSNFDFLRMSLFSPAFGDAASAFRLNNAVGTSEGFVPTIDFTKVMPPYGIKLDVGTLQRLILTVRDDTTAVDGFNAIAYGFDRLL